MNFSVESIWQSGLDFENIIFHYHSAKLALQAGQTLHTLCLLVNLNGAEWCAKKLTQFAA